MKEGSLTELMSSLNQGAKINACDSEGKTVLHVAAQRDHVEIVDAPLRNNIDVNALDDHQWAPLHLAAAHEGQLAVIQLPLEKCADFLAKNRHDTVLHQTVFGINHEVIKSILNKMKEKCRDDSQTWCPAINGQNTESDTTLMCESVTEFDDTTLIEEIIREIIEEDIDLIHKLMLPILMTNKLMSEYLKTKDIQKVVRC